MIYKYLSNDLSWSFLYLLLLVIIIVIVLKSNFLVNRAFQKWKI